MLQRIITAIIMIAILIPILIFSWTYEFLIPTLMAILSCIASFEYLNCIGKEKELLLSIPANILSLVVPFLTYFSESISDFLVYSGALFTIYLLYLFTIAIFKQGQMKFEEVATTFVGIFYFTMSFSSLSLLRHQTFEGGYLYLLVFFGAWVTDTFAYFGGRLFGKHKLNPVISPKKTVEGSITGILFCMISFVAFGLVMQFAYEKTVNYVMLLICGFLCSIVSQVGDLITSLIKREHDVKDYGKIFPGHGGVLDRFDSVLAISPMLLILTNLDYFSTWFLILR